MRVGSAMVMPIDQNRRRSDELAPWILAHHERPDGLGCPLGLGGSEIPFEARLIAVADAYDAMTTDRPHRRALSHEGAMDELAAAAGSQFDLELVEAFTRSIDTLIGGVPTPGV